ncbi:MAG TPA: HDOD domain-containing protein [Gammaproteobacteria bacterium]|nr:HDOD domain-containing protein [Gammaproteobacteria bacterium]
MPSPSTASSRSAETIQVGRQAIFDRELKVFAYELLYRDAGGRCSFTDGDMASSLTLLNAFMEIGLDRITGPYKAFINLTRPFFVDMPPIPFNPDRVVLEILEDVNVDEELLLGISSMAGHGFELAMDDYNFQPHLQPILPLVSYIKVEIQPGGMEELTRRMPELRATGARLLAEKVETVEQFEQLKALGFDYFQGYFFARPSIVRTDRVEENSAMVVRLLARLNDPDVPMQEVIDLVSRDPGLSFKVLRYVNSAGIGLRSKVESIQRAVVLMGLARIRAWATLFAMAGLGNRPLEILNVGLLRANLCERLCRLCRSGTPETAYTVGLLSVLDLMLSQPLAGLMDQLPLSDEVKRAIVAHEGGYGKLLEAAVTLERNEWPQDLCADIEPAVMIEAYAASSESAFSAMELLHDA